MWYYLLLTLLTPLTPLILLLLLFISYVNISTHNSRYLGFLWYGKSPCGFMTVCPCFYLLFPSRQHLIPLSFSSLLSCLLFLSLLASCFLPFGASWVIRCPRSVFIWSRFYPATAPARISRIPRFASFKIVVPHLSCCLLWRVVFLILILILILIL